MKIDRLKVLTLNIHKGLSHFNRRMVLHDLREGLQSLNPDVVFLQEVQGKLPVVNTALAGLDEAAKRLFNSSRYGEWLNQTIPCGALLNGPTGPVVPVNDPCITGAGSAGLSGSQSQSLTPAQGPQAVSELLTQGLGR